MKKSDFRKMLQGVRTPSRKSEVITVQSVTDPSFAQSGRELVFNPLGYETKAIYANGVALDNMQPFDGMYVDKHAAFQSAKELDAQQHEHAKKSLKEHKEKQDNKSQND